MLELSALSCFFLTGVRNTANKIACMKHPAAVTCSALRQPPDEPRKAADKNAPITLKTRLEVETMPIAVINLEPAKRGDMATTNKGQQKP